MEANDPTKTKVVIYYRNGSNGGVDSGDDPKTLLRNFEHAFRTSSPLVIIGIHGTVTIINVQEVLQIILHPKGGDDAATN